MDDCRFQVYYPEEPKAFLKFIYDPYSHLIHLIRLQEQPDSNWVGIPLIEGTLPFWVVCMAAIGSIYIYTVENRQEFDTVLTDLLAQWNDSVPHLHQAERMSFFGATPEAVLYYLSKHGFKTQNTDGKQVEIPEVIRKAIEDIIPEDL